MPETDNNPREIDGNRTGTDVYYGGVNPSTVTTATSYTRIARAIWKHLLPADEWNKWLILGDNKSRKRKGSRQPLDPERMQVFKSTLF